MNKKNNDMEKDHIAFVDACPPTLTAGEYAIEINQEIKVFDKVERQLSTPAFEKKKTFWVSAPRFSLDPSDIYSVYPPAGHEGRYQNCLPHVVFTRKTLPWERTLDGAAPDPERRLETPPWMALLLFDEDEIETHAVKMRPVQIKDLINPPDGRVRGPDIVDPDRDSPGRNRLDPWELLEDPCNVIDVPEKLLKDIAPLEEDLRYLAHARQVDMDDKEIPEIAAGGWFSVLFCNRLPKQDRRNTVFLVSLEGFEDLLHNERGASSDEKKVRLVVLTTWTFMATGPDFETLMHHLKEGKNGEGGADFLRIRPAKDHTDETVEKALNLGYTALNHKTRLGEKTVSWYRGPLVPLSLAKLPYNYIHESADAALRYDPDTGLFDVSYAAAWQLGRLMALQKSEFSLALYHWRSDTIHQATLDLAETLLELHYHEKPNVKDAEALLQDDLMTNLLMALWESQVEAEKGGETSRL